MFKSRIERFKANPIEWGLTCVSLVLLCIDVFQFIDSDFMTEPLIRSIFDLVFAVSLIIIGEKCITLELFCFAMACVQYITFENYTPFLLICLCCLIKKNSLKFVIPMINAYAFDVVIVCMRHDKSPVHLVRHGIVCVCIFVTIQLFVRYFKRDTPLDLTDEECRILDALAIHGLKQKEIDGLKQNTVAKKLKICREKNNCKTNDELFDRFKAEKKQGINYPQNSNNLYSRIYSIIKNIELP